MLPSTWRLGFPFRARSTLVWLFWARTSAALNSVFSRWASGVGFADELAEAEFGGGASVGAAHRFSGCGIPCGGHMSGKTSLQHESRDLILECFLLSSKF